MNCSQIIISVNSFCHGEFGMSPKTIILSQFSFFFCFKGTLNLRFGTYLDYNSLPLHLIALSGKIEKIRHDPPYKMYSMTLTDGEDVKTSVTVWPSVGF